MIKKSIWATFVCLLASFSAHAQMDHAHGYLYQVPTTRYFDFQYHTAMSHPTEHLQRGGTLKLQSRFIWGAGPKGRVITTPQHSVVAFTQRGATTNMVNPRNQMYWTHGAGAFVGELGLQLELWFVTDRNGNGLDDEPLNAYTWSQQNNRCASEVLGTLQGQVMCLGSEPNGWGYITPAPDFKLRADIPYWVRVTIAPSSPGWATLFAELYEQDCDANYENCSTHRIQHALIGFEIARFFPISWLPMEASNGRTPGSASEPYVKYDTFNYGW